VAVVDSALGRWLDGGGGELRWVEFDAYAHRVFGGDSPDWYRDAPRHAGAFLQAQGVIRSQCLSLDLTGPCRERCTEDAATVQECLADADGLAFLDQFLGAVVHRHGGQIDLVLELAVPADLLAAGEAADFDQQDDVATALAALVRRYADRPVAALLLRKTCGGVPTADECDAWEPLLGAARHYGWRTALALPVLGATPAAAPALDLDVLLLPAVAASSLPPAVGTLRVGGGLDVRCWSGAGPDARGGLLYGSIPADASPETVNTVVRALG